MRHMMIEVSRDVDDLFMLRPEGAPGVIDGDRISRQALEVVGGFLLLDVDGGDVIPTAVIEQPTVSAPWVRELYGADVAFALNDAFSAPYSPIAVLVAAPITELSRVACSLLRGMWLRRWWPSPTGQIPALTEWLLDAELGSLAFDASTLFADIEPSRELLALAGSELEESGGLDLAEPVARIVRVARERASMLAVTPITAHPSSIASSHARERRAFAARVGSGPVDWRTVPPRQVSASDDAVRWSISRSDDVTDVKVSVEAAPTSQRSPLFFRVHHDADTVSARLLLADGEYTGSVQIDPEIELDDIIVSVQSKNLGTRGRRPPDVSEVARIREQVVAIVEARLRRTDTSDDDVMLAAERVAATTASSVASLSKTVHPISFPAFVRTARAAAASDGDLPSTTADRSGLTLRLTSLGASSVHIALGANADIAHPLDVVVISATTAATELTVVVALDEIDGLFFGEATVQVAGNWEGTSVTLPQQVTQLSPAIFDSLGASVRATSREGTGAWRRILATLPEEHPAAIAIYRALAPRNPRG